MFNHYTMPSRTTQRAKSLCHSHVYQCGFCCDSCAFTLLACKMPTAYKADRISTKLTYINECEKKPNPSPLKNKQTRFNQRPTFPSTKCVRIPDQRTNTAVRTVPNKVPHSVSSGTHSPTCCYHHLSISLSG